MLSVLDEGAKAAREMGPPQVRTARTYNRHVHNQAILFLYHAAFKLYSLWHVGYLLDDFYDLQVCSYANFLMYNSACCPNSIELP